MLQANLNIFPFPVRRPAPRRGFSGKLPLSQSCGAAPSGTGPPCPCVTASGETPAVEATGEGVLNATGVALGIGPKMLLVLQKAGGHPCVTHPCTALGSSHPCQVPAAGSLLPQLGNHRVWWDEMGCCWSPGPAAVCWGRNARGKDRSWHQPRAGQVLP